MNVEIVLSSIAAIFSLALAVFVFLRDRQSFSPRILTVGMVVFALKAGLTGLSFLVTTPSELGYWQHTKLIVGSIIPGIWLIFSLSFARANYRAILSRWKWIVLASFIVPFLMATLFGHALFVGERVANESFSEFIRLGWSGYGYYLFTLLGAVLILMNLERTFRHSSGYRRWQLKFIIIGIGGLFGVDIYIGSQTILYRVLDTNLEMVSIGALIVGNVLVFRSLLRMKIFNIDFYLSHSVLYNSLTLLLIGIYFMAVGFVAEIVVYFNPGQNLLFATFLVFVAVVGLSVLLFSDRLRIARKRFISRHFNRPRHDYRKEWAEFTRWTTSITEHHNLCNAVAKIVSRTLEVLSVSIWLVDEKDEHLLLGGSTGFSELEAKDMKSLDKGAKELIDAFRNESMPVDFDSSKEDWASDLKQANPDYFRNARVRYCVPLVAGEKLLGVMTLDDRIAGLPLTIEDFDLLKTIADQTAGSLLNLKLSESIRRLREAEAYKNMSAFMMHDLKNLASMLSLTVQNLPAHFDNPEFRKDALQIIQQSLTKLNTMCSRLSMLSQKIELKRIETDLNDLVTASLSCLNGSSQVSITQDLQLGSRVVVDPEQIQKVLTNLLLNAKEALRNGGEIRIATWQREGWAVVSIRDNGSGMSKEFVERSLFQPFKTTKEQGMGIGLFHSKMIVEAHKGRIEVESEQGKGSTFRVLLPVKV